MWGVVVALFFACFSPALAQTFSCANITCTPGDTQFFYDVCRNDVGTPQNPGCLSLSKIQNGLTLVEFNSLVAQSDLPFTFSCREAPLLLLCALASQNASDYLGAQIMRNAFAAQRCGFGMVRGASGQCQYEEGSGPNDRHYWIMISLASAILLCIVVRLLYSNSTFSRWMTALSEKTLTLV